MTTQRVVVRTALAILLCGAWSLRAQKPAQVELGFKADGLYQFSGLDSVNLFNGNLVVQIPIGSSYALDGGLKYGLTLSYNSKVWDYDQTRKNGQTYVASQPNWRSNAGVGWRLSLGRLLGSTDPTANYPQWIYEGPSGEEHVFVESYENHPRQSGRYWYSVGEQRLRLVKPVSGEIIADYPNDTVRLLEFPDGTVHTFTLTCKSWQLRKIADRFGNYLKVTPSCDTENRVFLWTLHDSVGRTHTVNFAHHSTTANSVDRGQHVDSVNLSTVAGLLTYKFVYDPYPVLDWGCGHNADPDAKLPQQATLPLLQKIILPDQTSFAFEYYRSGSQGGYCAQGAMSKLTVPTGGEFGYTYQQMQLPEDYCYLPQFPSRNPGVRTRMTPDGRWDYLATVSQEVRVDAGEAASFCRDYRNLEPNEMRTPGVDPVRRWARMTVLAPPVASSATGPKTRMRTDSYFHAWTDAPTPVRDLWNKYDETRNPRPALVRFGQALTTGAPPASALGPVGGSAGHVTDDQDQDARVDASGDVHYLSTRTFAGCADETAGTVTGRCENGQLLRSSFQRYGYALDVTGSAKWTYPAESSRTVHEDAKWVQTSASGPDGYGKFKTSTSTSNFSGAVNVEFQTTTNFLGLVSSGKWLLNLYDYTSRSEEGTTARTDYLFDTDTGFLKATRTRAASGQLSSHDVLTLLSGTKGNVEVEESYGGGNADAGPLHTEAAQAFTSPGLSHRQYLTKNTFAYGALVKTEVCNPAVSPASCGTVLTKLDIDLHSSGSPMASRDPAGIATSYEYDEYGRLETVKAPGPSNTTYVYTAATPSSNASVRETVTTGTGVLVSETVYEFDRVGRPVKTTRSLPGQRRATVVTMYDALGRKIAVSQPYEGATPEFWTKTRYDALGRPLEIESPDHKKTFMEYGGEQWMKRTVSIATSQDSESPVAVTEHYDAQRRLIRIVEGSGGTTSASRPIGDPVTTSYKYDVGSRLVSVITGEQTRTFQYDLRGFLIQETHPESGTTKYENHDARGQARRKVDADGNYLSFEHDPAGRLTKISDAAGVLKTFRYATANLADNTNRQAGKLVETTRRNDVAGGTIEAKEEYEYNAIGQLSLRRTLLARVVKNPDNTDTRFPIQTFVHTIPEYDELRLPKKIGMPTCAGCPLTSGITDVTHERDAGYLTSVIGYANLTYAPSGAVRRVEHQLSATQTTTADVYASDSGTTRPSSITLGGSVCPVPAPVIQSSAAICPGKAGTASVVKVPGASYSWTIQGGSFTSAPNSESVTFQASGSGSVSLAVAMTNACGTGQYTKTIAASAVLAPPVITAPAAACANTLVNASVPANPDVTYTWTMSPGSWTATGPTVSFTAPSSAFTLTVTAQNSCGGTTSSSRQIEVAPPAAARLYLIRPWEVGTASRVRGTTESVTLKVEFPETTGPWEISWNDDVHEIATQNPHERVVKPDQFHEYRLRSVSPQRCGEPTGIVYVHVLPPAPSRVLATTQADGKVFISWTSVPGAAGYSIERADRLTGARQQLHVAPANATSYLYIPTGSATTPAVHFYYVLAIDPEIHPGLQGPTSRPVAFDHAITGTSPVADTYMTASDIVKLRAAIDAYRLAFGVPPATYPTTPAAWDWIAAADVSDLVVRLNHARPPTDPFFYRDVPPPVSHGIFYREHLQQLWDALR